MPSTPSLLRRRPGRTTWLVGAPVLVLVTLLVTAGLTSLAWGDALREEGRLLPGTTIAGVDVGGATVEEARTAVDEQLAPRLDHTVTIVHEDAEWEVTARELGARSDAATVVDEAFARTDEAGLADLTRGRWTGATIGPELDVSLGVPEEEIEDHVAGLAEERDRAPTDATLSWQDDAFVVEEATPGREVDTTAAAAALTAAFEEQRDRVELPVEERAPELPTAAARAAADALTPVARQALDHAVTAVHGERTWTVTPRELGATPSLDASPGQLADAPEDAELALAYPDGAVSGFVAELAGELDVAARDAQLDLSDGFEVVPARDGRALDREAARAELTRALDGAADRVELTVATTEAGVSDTSFDRVLVLRQGERRLSLYEDGEATRSWPVAVGSGGSPTPTGQFTVGAKRYEPTWHNPSPDGWGSDMPASIGPGADNPLGLRAINWNDGGRDTLIRFHGTPNEDSIGEAASQGCVRMFNDDVIELYDLVHTGMPIVSVG